MILHNRNDRYPSIVGRFLFVYTSQFFKGSILNLTKDAEFMDLDVVFIF